MHRGWACAFLQMEHNRSNPVILALIQLSRWMDVKFLAVPKLAIHQTYNIPQKQEEHEIKYANNSHRDVTFSHIIECAIN